MVKKILEMCDSKTVEHSLTDVSILEDPCKYLYSCRYNKSPDLCVGGHYNKCLEYNDHKKNEKRIR